MSSTGPSQLQDLTPQQCWDLVTQKVVGRVAWCGPQGPTVIPVNFTADGTHVHIRTAAYSTLVQQADDSQVAFEVDDIDEESHAGWSVLMRGRARTHYQDRDPDRAPDTWVAGARFFRVTIEVDEITGRRLTP